MLKFLTNYAGATNPVNPRGIHTGAGIRIAMGSDSAGWTGLFLEKKRPFYFKIYLLKVLTLH